MKGKKVFFLSIFLFSSFQFFSVLFSSFQFFSVFFSFFQFFSLLFSSFRLFFSDYILLFCELFLKISGFLLDTDF